MTDSDAFEEGYDAYWDGLPLVENPYDPEKQPERRESWEEGWRAARKHDYDERDS